MNDETFPKPPEILAEIADIDYFKQRLKDPMILPEKKKQIERQIELLEDAAVIYKMHRPSR